MRIGSRSLRSGFLLALAGVALHPWSARAGEEHSVARFWNEALLEAIRHDFARPTVHARNLFHTAIALYDMWAVYDETAETFFLGKTVDGFTCDLVEFPAPADMAAARSAAMCHAAYTLLSHRFAASPGAEGSQARFDSLMNVLGFPTPETSTDYTTGSPAALGNYLGEKLIEFGHQDRANEQGNYAALHYEPFNPPLLPVGPGNPDIIDMNRWQPITIDGYIDQSGNPVPGVTTPAFVSPEWGAVSAFALSPHDRHIYHRDGYDYWVYHDPGPPPLVDETQTGGLSEEYKWGFALVAIWSGQLDQTDGVMWDISPGGIGNLPALPQTVEDYRDFYDLLGGGDRSPGYDVNPATGLPYEPQMVPRGDYGRVLAEFWADGPASETPPGHWFTILNYVHDHPAFERRWRGEGPILDTLEWDVKAYLTLGAAMHDVAVTVWGIKGWYDYVRPISAIRAMADRGQSTEPAAPDFHPAGLPLIPGAIERVLAGDPLEGDDGENIGKIKVYAWRGPTHIIFPETDQAGADWILAENWWPYQRPTFITPPFAGYVSGHSTFSRTAAEVLTLMTGDPYFPGGMGEFHAPMNEFLVFEEGPSMDVTLQWAQYRDASDQCSLSRIWGGIHPPADDIPGRKIGLVMGPETFARAEQYFNGTLPEPVPGPPMAAVRPNPVGASNVVTIALTQPVASVEVQIADVQGRVLYAEDRQPSGLELEVSVRSLPSGVYFMNVVGSNWTSKHRVTVVR